MADSFAVGQRQLAGPVGPVQFEGAEMFQNVACKLQIHRKVSASQMWDRSAKTRFFISMSVPDFILFGFFFLKHCPFQDDLVNASEITDVIIKV